MTRADALKINLERSNWKSKKCEISFFSNYSGSFLSEKSLSWRLFTRLLSGSLGSSPLPGVTQMWAYLKAVFEMFPVHTKRRSF